MSILAILLFFAEIVFFFGLGRAVYLLFKINQWPMPFVFGVLAVLLVIVTWALFMSPKADRRLDKLPRVLVMAAGMLATGFSLLSLGDKTTALVLLASAVIAVIGQWLIYEN
ncbi:MAG: YrdB family protein [Tissierellia bacterium]|nr:YrdB family protein [Tissierellia bacterium]